MEINNIPGWAISADLFSCFSLFLVFFSFLSLFRIISFSVHILKKFFVSQTKLYWILHTRCRLLIICTHVHWTVNYTSRSNKLTNFKRTKVRIVNPVLHDLRISVFSYLCHSLQSYKSSLFNIYLVCLSILALN